MRLDQALPLYLNHLATERNLSANTIESYRRDLEHYLVGIDSSTSIDQIEEERIQNFIKWD